jgi:hypothetical protein
MGWTQLHRLSAGRPATEQRKRNADRVQQAGGDDEAQAVGDQERQFERLRGVEPRVAGVW